MKKYVVKNKNTQQIFGKFDTKNQAAKRLVDYVCYVNEDASSDDDEFLCIFDFDIQEQEGEDAKNIGSYEEACRYLQLPQDPFEHTIIGIRNRKHREALAALTALLTLAEAWNKTDGFIPDFNNEHQRKYFPLFAYDKDSERFVFSVTAYANNNENAYLGSRLCFASHERAREFAERYESLYKDFLVCEDKL